MKNSEFFRCKYFEYSIHQVINNIHTGKRSKDVKAIKQETKNREKKKVKIKSALAKTGKFHYTKTFSSVSNEIFLSFYIQSVSTKSCISGKCFT